jgi:hypothetical protein
MKVLDAIYGLSLAWSSINPVKLVWIWRKLLPNLEDYDLQDLPNEEISKSETDMVSAIWSFGNINEEMLKNDYRVVCVK